MSGQFNEKFNRKLAAFIARTLKCPDNKAFLINLIGGIDSGKVNLATFATCYDRSQFESVIEKTLRKIKKHKTFDIFEDYDVFQALRKDKRIELLNTIEDLDILDIMRDRIRSK